MKTLDEYIMFFEWYLYDFLSATLAWLNQTVVALGPFGSVPVTISHIFLLFFVIITLGYCWLQYKLFIRWYREEAI